LSACKKAEEDEALIIRVYNLSADPQQGTVTLFQHIRDVKIVNLNEQENQNLHISDLNIENNQFSFQIDGFKIATFKVFFE
jgi:alpha-mannosidase